MAIAPDSWRPASELGPDDFQVAAISEVWQRPGYIRVDCQARPGYRLRLVVSSRGGGTWAGLPAAWCNMNDCHGVKAEVHIAWRLQPPSASHVSWLDVRLWLRLALFQTTPTLRLL